MKKIIIKIKFFYFIARYLQAKNTKLKNAFIRQTSMFGNIINSLQKNKNELKTEISNLNKRLYIEQDYNLNARMRRRNKFWRSKRNTTIP